MVYTDMPSHVRYPQSVTQRRYRVATDYIVDLELEFKN